MKLTTISAGKKKKRFMIAEAEDHFPSLIEALIWVARKSEMGVGEREAQNGCHAWDSQPFQPGLSEGSRPLSTWNQLCSFNWPC